jgi:hypothetical protein
MAEISNNLIAGLLLVAIVVSIVGLVNTISLIPVIQYTGFATTGAGKANVTIESAMSITLMRNETLFGPGYANTAGDLVLATNKTNPEGTAGTTDGWFNNGSEGNGTDYGQGSGPYAYPFVVQNDGNEDATHIKVYANKDADAFIGGVGSEFQFAGENNESVWGSTEPAGSCPLPSYTDACTSGLIESWQDMPTGSGTEVCAALNATDCSDEMRIHFRLSIPYDAPSGGKTATVTVEAAAS